MNIDAYQGMNVVTSSGDWYGPLGKLGDRLPLHWKNAFDRKNVVPFAEDECGNFFIQHQDRRIGFWDHETDVIVWLSLDEEGFLQLLTHEAPKVELDEGRVLGVWVDPNFKPEFQ